MKIELVIPTFNEEKKIGRCLETLVGFFSARNHLNCHVMVADNGSTDGTYEIAADWSSRHSLIHAVRISAKGRGRALKAAWSESTADILSYMDVDLSTGLDAFPIVVLALAQGDYDLATGSRLLPGARTERCLKRECLSRGYNALVKFVFNTRFSDAQCGFKAITRRAAHELLPLVEDTQWFFDTELMVIAEKRGYRLFDYPVQWIENRDTRVRIWRTVFDDLMGVLRLRRNLRGVNNRQRSGKDQSENRPASLTPPSLYHDT